VEKLNSSNVSSKVWFKTAKKITNRHKTNHIPTLNDKNTEASADEEKANLLKRFFCSQSTIDDSHSQLPEINALTNSTLEDLTITEQDVKDAVSCIDPSKASGPDLVSPMLIREGVDVLAGLLSSFFTKLIATSIFPLPWKNVCAIFKKSDPSKPSHYRPVSILSCLGKKQYGTLYT